jgi:hypothetical protein
MISAPDLGNRKAQLDQRADFGAKILISARDHKFRAPVIVRRFSQSFLQCVSQKMAIGEEPYSA